MENCKLYRIKAKVFYQRFLLFTLPFFIPSMLEVAIAGKYHRDAMCIAVIDR